MGITRIAHDHDRCLIAYLVDGGLAASDGSFGRSANEPEGGICSNTIVRCRADGQRSYAKTCSGIFIYKQQFDANSRYKEHVSVNEAGRVQCNCFAMQPSILLGTYGISFVASACQTPKLLSASPQVRRSYACRLPANKASVRLIFVVNSNPSSSNTFPQPLYRECSWTPPEAVSSWQKALESFPDPLQQCFAESERRLWLGMS